MRDGVDVPGGRRTPHAPEHVTVPAAGESQSGRLAGRQRQDIESFPNVKRWFDVVASRPAVAKDMDKLEDIVDGFTPQSWEVSFGTRQKTQT